MTKKELAQDALKKIEQFCQRVPPKERFARLVSDQLINQEGEVLVTKEEREAGHPLENGSLNGLGPK